MTMTTNASGKGREGGGGGDSERNQMQPEKLWGVRPLLRRCLKTSDTAPLLSLATESPASWGLPPTPQATLPIPWITRMGPCLTVQWAAAATLALFLGWVHWAFQEVAQIASTPHLITPSSCILSYFVMQLKLGQRMYSKISDVCFKTSYTIGAPGDQGYRVSPKPWSQHPAWVRNCTCFFYLSILLKQTYRIAKDHLKMRAVG